MVYAIAAAWYAAMTIATYAAFAHDKRAAAARRWRIPERKLHTLSLLGGWPGALLAMRVVRHKGRKPVFVVTTAIIAASHLALWWALATHVLS